MIGLSSEIIEDRFHLSGNQGAAYSVVGDCTQGVAGGGFLYTNKNSVSVGVVLRLDDLADRGLSSSDVHDHFLAHPAIAPLLKKGELLEYGCHLTIEGGPSMVSHDLTRPGLVLVGDAAGFTLNTGLTIRGMDLAAGSALAAATAVDKALKAHDFSQGAMDAYRGELDAGFVGADMKTYQKAPRLLENPLMYGEVGALLGDVMHDIYDHDLTPRKHLLATAMGGLRRSRMKAGQLARLGVGAVRAL